MRQGRRRAGIVIAAAMLTAACGGPPALISGTADSVLVEYDFVAPVRVTRREAEARCAEFGRTARYAGVIKFVTQTRHAAVYDCLPPDAGGP